MYIVKYQSDSSSQPGNYSRLQCDIFLVRSIGFYVSQVYIPAFLIVVISWVPFWLDRHDHHARVALGVTTVLTMTTLTTNTNSDFPKISHLKAIDIYLFVSFIMVFLSLIEYATVGYYESKSEKESKSLTKEEQFPQLHEKWNTDHNDSDNFRYDADNPKDIKLKQLVNRKKSTNEHNNLLNIDEQFDKVKDHSKESSIQSDQKQKLIRDTSIIDQGARWIFPATFAAFNLIYVLVLCLLVSIYSNHLEIQVKL